jgi:SAM-dependent methyltransferase
MSSIREAVHERYRAHALKMASTGCCDESCCGEGASDQGCGSAYTAADLQEVGLQSGMSLGCGNPMLLAQLNPGEQVLDLGSGGGLDVLLSARRVAPGGHAYGVDMTDEMLALANRNREQAGIENATFLKGTIEQVPLPDASIDVVISNCVINLAEDKGVVIREAFRVLKPGGRFAVSDMVALHELPAEVQSALDAWAGCVAGTIPIDDYRQLMVDAGFEGVDFEITQEQSVEGLPGAIGSAAIRARKPAN